MPSMDEHHVRRHLRRIVATITISLGLLLNYVAGYVGSGWLRGAGVLTTGHVRHLDRSVFAPLVWYIDTRRPGAATIEQLANWCETRAAGTTITFAECAPW